MKRRGFFAAVAAIAGAMLLPFVQVGAQPARPRVYARRRHVAAFAYGQGASISIPHLIVFTSDDADRVTAMVNEFLRTMPVDFVEDEYAEWRRLSVGS